ncbi:cytochrome P450 [Streptomonospora sp. S1-112]|uniref:Cytochrome P450 n=1 Tax=Streptomonospora mangrovi TaxID=2883123 RepID=A0A9X3SFB6_9ACTN|nr:hypothetical protein [Streptomonospora mangrovi]MDA0564615.1 cytochrome P450 [Streptomonospora mangrovi]
MKPSDILPLYQATDRLDQVCRTLRHRFGDVAPVMLDPYTFAWLTLTWESTREAMTSPDFSADPDNWRDRNSGHVPQNSGIAAMLVRRDAARWRDGDEHRRYREALQAALQRLIDNGHVLHAVADVADRIIDRITPRGRADLIGDYAGVLSGMVLARLIGFDQDEAERIGDEMATVWDGEPAAAYQAWLELDARLHRLAAERRRRPAPNDVVSHLVHHGEHSDQEAAHQVALLIAAGYDPLTHLIGNTLRVLLTDDSLRRQLLSAGTDVESLLDVVQVHNPPLAVVPGRWCVVDREFGGHRVRAGDMVVFGIEATNRQLPPGTRAHLGWGAGPHACPRSGSDIAGVVAAHAVRRLITRVPVRLAVAPDQLERRASLAINGLRELPVLLNATGMEAAPTVPEEAPPAPAGAAEPPAPVRTGPARGWIGALARLLLGRR